MKTDKGQDILFLRKDGTLTEYPVFQKPNLDGEMFFFELVGFSGDTKGGVTINGEEKYKRFFIQKVQPVIEN